MTSTNNTSGAILIAEIGSVTTRVILADTVEGETRLIFQMETPSTIEPPERDATVAILRAVSEIAELTGRNLIHDGQLIMPQTPERDGVNHVVATTSAAGTMALIITAVASDVSARSALHAIQSTYTKVLQVVTLDDAKIDPTAKSSASWMERQIETMLTLTPDVVFIAGGLEGGPQESLCRLAQMVAFTSMHALHSSFEDVTAPDEETDQRPNQDLVAIYGGNSQARQAVREVLSGRVKTLLVDNVRPALDQERLDDANQSLNQLYDDRILPRLPGIAALQSMTSAPVTTVCKSVGLMTRFLAERYGRQVLALDIGTTSSSAFLASPGKYNLKVLGLCGTGYGLATLLDGDGVARVARWLPFSMSDNDLTHWLLNKILRPHLIPANREDLLIEHAITRELLTLVLHTLRDECPDLGYDIVIAGGGVLANAPPGLATLTLLDALQPAGAVGVEHAAPLALDLHVDTLGLMPACGALSSFNPDAAVTMFERDMLQNTPLATCVVALGSGRTGKVALEAELTQSGHGKAYMNRGTQRIQVHHGEIVHLPLDQGARAQLTLRPTGGVRIGHNAPGAEVQSEVSAINGSTMGVIIDARGRPLHLPDHQAERTTLLWNWLVALGVVQGQRPTVEVSAVVPGVQVPRPQPATTESIPVAAAVAVSATVPPEDKIAAGKHTSLADMMPQQPAESSEATVAEGEHAAVGKRVSLADMMPQQPTTSSEVAGAGGEQAAGKRVSLADMLAEPSAPASANTSSQSSESGSLESDLSSLRQTVETKPKRGLFGRKKK